MIGQSLPRPEDERFLRGRGRFVADQLPPNALHVGLVRSPHARARIRAIDTGAARAMPGVVGVLTGDDWLKAGFGELPCIWRVDSRDGTPMREAPRPALVPCAAGNGEVRHVGDIVAAVIAETREEALDAAEAVSVDYDALSAVVDARLALGENAALVHEQFRTNVCFDLDFGDRGLVESAFKGADTVVQLELINNRVAPTPLEPRATLGHYEQSDDRYTLWTSSQNPHLVRRWLAESSLRIPEHRIRVIAPDVGGGFGQKISHYPEEPIVLWASKLFGRPVSWNGSRSENLLEDTQARDHATSCAMAFDRDGAILAMTVDTIASIGAYVTAFGAAIPGYFYAPLLSGMYRIPAIYCRVRGVFTNTTPVDAYRGAGRPEAAYVVERLIDQGARELRVSPIEIRRGNFVRSQDFPYVSAVNMRYDSGNYSGLMDKLELVAEIQALREEQRRLRQQGVYVGVGISAFIDSSGGTPSRLAASMGRRVASWDNAVVRVHPTGKISVFCGGHSHGQGHATTFAQIVGDRLGCPIEDIEIVEGDTDRIPYGHGTYGSRSLSVIGVAIALATEKVVAKGTKIAAHMFECAEADIRFSKGKYTVAGTDRSVSFDKIALAAHHLEVYPDKLEPGLEESSFYDPPGRSVPSGLHLCVAVVDPETGQISLKKFYAVDDVGRVVNPMIVEGQIHGGIAQGIGQALMEQVVFDGHGQLLTGTLMDYALPRASDLPAFTTERQQTFSPDNILGVKGAGESGTIGAPVAVVNAVIDALTPLGVTHLEMPLTPYRVWSAIQKAQRKAAKVANNLEIMQ